MVGHSQLESDIVEASPPPMAAADGDDDSVAEPAQAAAVGEAPMPEDKSDDDTEAGTSDVGEALQGIQNSPEHGTAAQSSFQRMPVPQPGRKRKRSSLCPGGGHQDAASVGHCRCCNI